MPYGVHVTGLTAQQVAGPLLIVEVEVLLQELAVDRVAHGIQHILRAGLKDNLRPVAQRSAQDRDDDQQRDQLRQQVIVSASDHVVDNRAGDDRLYDGKD